MTRTSSPAADSPRRNASEANVNQSPHLSGRVGCAETGPRPSDQAAARLAALRFDPARMAETLVAFHDLVIACVNWADTNDECLRHYPADEMDRAIELLNPIFGEVA